MQHTKLETSVQRNRVYEHYRGNRYLVIDIAKNADLEYGGSGWWGRSLASWKAVEWLSIGVEYRRFSGIGPQVTLLKVPVSDGLNLIPTSPTARLWSWTPLWDPEKTQSEPKLIVGLDILL